MNKNILVIGCSDPEAIRMADWFAAHGDTVYQNRPDEPLSAEISALDHLDLLILHTASFESEADAMLPEGGTILQMDDAAAMRDYDRYVCGCFELLEQCLPQLRKGRRRICILTDATCSVRSNPGTGAPSKHIMMAAVNDMVKLFFNRLRPEGFTFRSYALTGDPAGVPQGAFPPGAFFLLDFCYDARELPIHNEEERFVLKDGFLNEIAW